jgi:hypothetical protein
MGWNNPRLLMTPRSAITVLLGIVLVVVLSTFHRYGFTTDDENGPRRVAGTVAFLASGGADRESVSQFVHANFYGATPDAVALLLQLAFPVLSFDSRHVVSALFGVGGIYYAFRLGNELSGPWTGPVAAVLFTLNEQNRHDARSSVVSGIDAIGRYQKWRR